MAAMASTGLVDLAESIARAGGELVMAHYRSPGLEVETKPDGSFVTAADREAEQLMRRLIAEECPGDGIIGEEFSTVRGQTGREWILDPIDGTFSFVHGIPLFSTLVAVRDEGGPLAGVILAPALDEVAVAGRGLGCRVNGEPGRVNGAVSLDGALVATSGLADYWPGDSLDRLLGSEATVRTWADGGYGYLLLASGRVDAMIESSVKLWDVAAVDVIVPEAAGAVARFNCFESEGYAAANPTLLDQMLAVV